MGIVNLGSLNLDKVYGLNGFVMPGETVKVKRYNVYPGGKGLNQSVAIARAGATVFHVGMVGSDGTMLLDLLKRSEVNTDNIIEADCDSGHAVIQVNSKGQNCIIVCPGANGQVNNAIIDNALTKFSAGDFFLTQNETSCVDYAITAAHANGMKVILNPSPITDELLNCPLELVDLFILNEIEASDLTGCKGEYTEILNAMAEKFPKAEILLTVGENGSYYKSGESIFYQPACKVNAVDTTAAGDTFTGYFLAMLSEGKGIQECLKIASEASGIAVSRQGAAPSIPKRSEINGL